MRVPRHSLPTRRRALRATLPLALVGLLTSASSAQTTTPTSDAIRLNQLGFFPLAPKAAVVAGGSASTFTVERASGGAVVLRGALSAPKSWPLSGEEVRRADLSAVTRPGRYVVVVPGVGRSIPFDIGTREIHEVVRGSLKSYYYQRTGMPLLARYAGKWARAEGHPDTVVLVHASAVSATRPEGTRISSPRGWYDAGDYNKYVVNSGISTYTLLLIADQFPRYADALRLDIPESGNGLPDVLNEALWNIRWMLTMQDPADGGVYHKLTNAQFDAFIAPDKAVAPRYVVQKSTAAALDFAAVMAHASLVTRRYPRALPGFADSLTRSALAAWRWARLHPDSLYDQERLNATYKPAIATGTYGDRNVDDERRWAAAELALATKQDSFLVAVPPVTSEPATVPSWNSVGTLALISLLDHRRELTSAVDTTKIADALLTLARSLRAAADSSPYGVAMSRRQDFAWGSNAVAANQGLVLIQAARLTGDTTFLRAALANLDYVLGRNALGLSFVTGYGVKTPQAPHHRPSASDTVAAPVPGLLVGGPNPGQQDHCPGYTSTMPALSYVDAQCAYAANEVAINWNAPLSYLAAAVDAMYEARGRGARG
ncbi:MAG: glycoside hydrolase family 9, partial [Gemmatimonadetes bacterium]|nr:glycoside hydrolase family 9 [Gemmatimonadota bacterium]